MLTKSDLEAVGKLITNATKDLAKKNDINSFEKKFNSLEERITNIENGITDLEIKVDDKISDLESSNFRLKMEFTTEIKSIKRMLKKIENNQNSIIDHFDKEYHRLRIKVEKIETQLGFK